MCNPVKAKMKMLNQYLPASGYGIAHLGHPRGAHSEPHRLGDPRGVYFKNAEGPSLVGKTIINHPPKAPNHHKIHK